MEFYNIYEDSRRASAYDQLDLGGTYHIAFRDLPALLREHVAGDRAVDFGCGTGRRRRAVDQRDQNRAVGGLRPAPHGVMRTT